MTISYYASKVREFPKLLGKKNSCVVRGLGLPNDHAEYLASVQKCKALLSEGMNSKYYKDIEKNVRKYFSETKEHSLVYCHGINGFMKKLKPGIYKFDGWMLFIDSSKMSLKEIFLHNTY